MADRYCSHCGAEIRPGAGYCAACGGRVNGDGEAAAPPSVPAVASAPDATVAQGVTVIDAARPAVPVGASLAVFPWWQFILFPIVSLGVWAPYWFYCTRKQVNTLIENGRDDAGVQTLGSIVPIWQCWVARDIWRDINLVAGRAGTTGINASTYTVLFVVFSYVPIVNYLAFIVLILFCITQGRVTEAMDALSGGRAPRRGVTAWSAVWAALPLSVGLVIALIAAAG